MRVIEVSAFGGPGVLRLAERPDPAPGEGEVVVRIHAASINPTDLASRAGPRPSGPKPPFVPGWDLAGVVTAVGKHASGFQEGDRVCGMIPFGRIGGRIGAYAEQAAVSTDWLAHLPTDVSYEVGATLPLNGLTAHQGLESLRLKPRSRVLITGASGGVGGFATDLAVLAGHEVVAQAGRDDDAWVRSLGAKEVLPRDADPGKIAAVDAVFDAVPLGPARSTPALRAGGTAVFTRAPDPPTSERVKLVRLLVQSDPAALRELARLLGEGKLHTRVSEVLPLAEAAEGHRLNERGHLHGKVVLVP